MNNTLNDVLRDMFAPLDEYLLNPLSEPKPVKAGPNNWDEVKPEDFGPEHDFELYDHGTIWIFFPVSPACLQWCYRHLPEDAPRWGGKGYVVEHRFISDIVEGARRDKLMSEQDYIDAMEEMNDALQHQGENRG